MNGGQVMRAVWEQRVAKAVHMKIQGSIFAGFNTNVDVVVHLDKENVSDLINSAGVSIEQVNQIDVSQVHSIQDKNQFVAVVKDCLGKGKSFYIVLDDLLLLDWLDQVFTHRKELMGGQAGIIANQMACLQAKSIVYTSLLSPKQGAMFFPEVLYPVLNEQLDLVPVQDACRNEDSLKINWIFEYAKGEEFDFAGEKVVTPRANRVILATRPEGVVMGFDGEIAEHLPELGRKIDVAFLAGYHYAPTTQPELDNYLAEILDDIRLLKQGNSNIRLHFEYVPMKDNKAEKRMLQTVAREIQSFGINENEIRRVLKAFGYQKEVDELKTNERAFALYKGALRVMEQLAFERIQVHNLGYYVLVLKKPYVIEPSKVRDCCLYASSVNAIKAKYGGYVASHQLPEVLDLGLSTIGYEQLEGFYNEAKSLGFDIPENFCREGIWEREDHYVIVVPAHVVPHPVSTVGMGDTISSSSYASEFSGVCVEN